MATSKHTAAQCEKITSAAGALEWTVAFILVFYFLTLMLDLWPAGKSSPRYMRRLARWQEKNGEGHDFTGRGAFGEYPERWVGNGNGQAIAATAPVAGVGAGAGAGYGHGYGVQSATPTAAELEERMRREMWERNNGLEGHGQVQGRDSIASSQAPMMRQV